MTLNDTEKSGPRSPLTGLHSAQSTLRLEQIARLRARGIGNHIDLPQLVVCGDQSSGKSSVLEGLTGIPFPRQDGLCTKFATEIILQHACEDLTIVASILPSVRRSDSEKSEIGTFRSHLQSFEELPTLIEEVTRLMGIRTGGSDQPGPAFGEDVLRIEVRGPVGLHLSIVDIPGLISVPNEEQDDDDVQTVHSLVDGYISNPRTIILAVVQAGNDIANQSIIKKSRQFDAEGERTVGIITKPDLINKGSEKRIALLAANKDTTKLKLGFFLVKNPTPEELAKGITPEQRQKNEVQYFHTSPWKEQILNPERVGISSLRQYLQVLLDKHVAREIPKVRQDVQKLLTRTELELSSMGEKRDSPSKVRMFLTRLAMSFHRLVTSALNGTYDDTDLSFFSRDSCDPARRLRALIQNLNTKFAESIRVEGAKRKVVPETEPESDGNSGSESSDHDSGHQILVTEREMKEWIREVYRSSRGKELPGTYNYVLLAELFHEHSSPWFEIAVAHLHSIETAIQNCIKWVVNDISPDAYVTDELMDLVKGGLEENQNNAREELRKLWQDEQHQPVTYNHYFTDNIQKAREQNNKDALRKAMTETRNHDWNGKIHVSNNQLDIERLLAGLQQRIIVNMDEQACAEAQSSLNSYYKVAMKTFVDNVCRQVVERHLTRRLPSVFSAEKVAGLLDEDLLRIAGETPSRLAERKRLLNLRGDLESSLDELRRTKGMQ